MSTFPLAPRRVRRSAFVAALGAAWILCAPPSVAGTNDAGRGPALATPEPPGQSAPDPVVSPAQAPHATSGVPALAWVASVVPGVVVHGSGQYVAGRPETAVRLLAMETAGVGLVLAGGVPLVLTGASRYFVAPAAVAVIGGVGLFGMSFLADLYGLAAPEGGTGAPLRIAPAVESRIGYAYVYDPQFSYRHFMVTRADARFASIRLSPEAWIAPGGRNERLRLGAAYRLSGPLPDRRARDGSFVDLETAFTRHVFPPYGFSTSTVDLAVAGRLDFARLDRNLRGSFAEMSAGVAIDHIDYELPGAAAAGDTETLLLARFAYGLYLGGPDRNRGEVALYYDHRHDDFAAGLKMGGLGSGVAGHFGITSALYAGRFGVGAEVSAGSAYVATLSALYRHTEDP